MLAMNRKTEQAEIVDTTTEQHGKDFVTIKILKNNEETFNFALECKLGNFVRAVHPHQNEMKYSSREEARQAAVNSLENFAKQGRATARHLKDFSLDSEEWFFDF
jgi:hypothetical protein